MWQKKKWRPRMRHLKKRRKLGRNREHRDAMFQNMVTSFFEHERIQTTTAKVKELRRIGEKMITRAKENTLHNKRIVLKKLKNRDIVAKLFDEIAPKYKDVHGGYTRIIKLGRRLGDGADLSLLELVDVELDKKGKGKVQVKEQKTQKVKGEIREPDKVKEEKGEKEKAAVVKSKEKTVKAEVKKPTKEITKEQETKAKGSKKVKAETAISPTTAAKTDKTAKAKTKPSKTKSTKKDSGTK
jgi:large subunit ribosomal protein L17